MTLLGVGVAPAIVTGGYVGPGDTNATAFAWWGLRAYSAAMCGTKCVRLIRASDSAQSDFNTLSDGTFDISSATTWMTATTAKVVTLYDQSGGNKSFGAPLHLTQATDANRPAFILGAGPGGQPALRYSAITQVLNEYSGTTQSAVTTVYAQSKRTGGFTSGYAVMGQTGAGWQIGGGNVANTAHIFAGTFVYVAATDNVFHRCVGRWNDIDRQSGDAISGAELSDQPRFEYGG
jgi:hypothetical protein